MKEVWKEIPGFKYYKASNLGRIRSVDRIRPHGKCKNKTQFVRGKILKLTKTNQAYPVVGVYTGEYGNASKPIIKRVHVLIALTFFGPRPYGFDIAHLNGKGLDNRVTNLKYCTRKENEAHKDFHGTRLRGEDNPCSKLKNQDVRNIRKLVKIGMPHKKIASRFGISRRYIWEIYKKNRWGHIK